MQVFCLGVANACLLRSNSLRVIPTELWIDICSNAALGEIDGFAWYNKLPTEDAGMTHKLQVVR